MKLKLKTLFWISLLFTQLIAGQSLKLNNINQYIDVGDLDISGNQLTVEAKIFMSSTSLYAMNIVSKHYDQFDLNYLLRPKTFEISTNNGFYLMNNPYAMELNKWYHVAGTYDGQFVRYYVNGCLVIKNPASGNLLQNNITTGIGNRTQNYQELEQFFGSIDEVRIWNVCRSENDIKNNMNTLPNPTTQVGLKGYYKFNSNLLNEVVNQNHGVAVGPIQYNTESTSINSFQYSGYSIVSTTCSQYTIELLTNVDNAQYSPNGTNFSTSNTLSISPGNQNIWIRSPEGCVIQTVINLPPLPLTTPIFTQIAPICSGGSISLPLTSNNGITGRWSPALNNTTTTTYTFTPNSGQCSSTATMTIPITPQVAAPTGSSTQFFCSSATIADINTSGTSIKWYDTATGGNLIPNTTSLVNGNTYYASASSYSCESSTRMPVTSMVQNIPEITSSNTTICANQSVQLSIEYTPPTICNMNITPSSIPLGNPIPGFTYGGLYNGHYYYIYNTPTTWTAGELISRQSGGYLVCINDINENQFVSNLTNNNIWIGLFRDPTTCQFRWLDCMDITFTNWRPGEPNSNPCDEPYTQIIRGCSFGLNTWNNLNDISTNGSCYSNMVPIMEIDPVIYNSNSINTTTTYLWSTGETTSSINLNPLVTTTYWVDVTTNGITCRKSIIINVKDTPAPTGTGSQVFCIDKSIGDLAVNGTDVIWYPTATSTSALSNSTSLVNATSYFATQIIDGCESTTRFQTTVTIQKVPTPTGDTIQKFCFEENPIITNLNVSGTNVNWMDSQTNGTLLNNSTLLQDDTTYYAKLIDATTGCESLQRLAVTVDLFRCNIIAFNLVSTNGDPFNDKLTFEDISYFPDNSVKIYNRYGKLVWETTGYNNTNNAFKGKANVSGVYMNDSSLPAGTYFYILVYNNTYVGKQAELTGYLQVE